RGARALRARPRVREGRLARSDGQPRADQRALVGTRQDVQLPVGELDALLYPEEAETTDGGALDVEADSVVAHGQLDRVWLATHREVNGCRPCVVDEVGQRLLDGAIDRRFEVGLEAPVLGELDVSMDLEAVRRGGPLDQ